MPHDHFPDHAGYFHGLALTRNDPPETRRSKERAIALAAALTGVFVGAEVVGGMCRARSPCWPTRATC